VNGVEETTLLYSVGLGVEVASVALTALLFQLLSRQERHRRVFRIWADAWVVLTAALLALAPFLAVRERIFTPRTALPPGLVAAYAAYHLGKLVFVWLIVGGVRLFTRGGRWRRPLLTGLAVTVAYGVLTLAVSPDFPWTLVWQAVVLVPAMLYAAWLMLGLPRDRRTLGTALAGGALLAKGLVWLAQFPYFLDVARHGVAALAGPMNVAGRFGSFADQVIQVLLAIGFVLILMEETGREKDGAIEELAVARAELERRAMTDPLTGALNRLAFREGVGLHAARATWGTVCLLDLDNLKSTNDRYGHAAGDALLRAFSTAVFRCLGERDRLYRWGGDEFLVTMPNRTRDDAASAIVAALADRWVPVSPDGERVPVRASLGTADYGTGATLEEAIETADGRMYVEKRARKEAVRPAPPVLDR